ncbi:MAG: DNA-deoxyinosine glycosylase [Treponema sp.]|jgi:hypoxanthine-DNA glycosylase|nr:DNA-deoxyinosine glycosylase [Treponema sp.]
MQHIVHTIPPVYDSGSRVLILGTMPSPQSRAAAFYYGHKHNRFWAVLGAVFNLEIGPSAADKKHFLLSRGIALWDVLAECDISGASDSSIRNPAANDFGAIFAAAPVQAVLTTGRTAYRLYEKLCSEKYNAPFFYLPSTSPANCAVSMERITGIYKKLLLRFLTEPPADTGAEAQRLSPAYPRRSI